MKTISVFFGASDSWRGLTIGEVEEGQFLRLWEQLGRGQRPDETPFAVDQPVSAPAQISSKDRA